MKKVLIFLAILLSAIGLSSAGLESVGGTKNDSVLAYINVTDPASQFVYVGFSSTPVTQSNGELSGDNDISSIDLTTGNSTDLKAANKAGSLYVYGQLYTNISCDVKLSATSMQGYSVTYVNPDNTTSDHLGFTVTGIRSDKTGAQKILTVKKGTNDSTAGSAVFIDYTGTGEGNVPQLAFECYELKIETTEPITSGTSDTKYYATTIKVEVVAEGESSHEENNFVN